ncbi:hypothetical protein [Shewanella halifaxensis]|uniref:hypothetical protein n=1 Tax=Shewanella halifaxensis TaxID=271098 RepID=UPI000D59EEB0|nr:hypothetical protein [Shewanella halifaxensis]
MLIRNKIVFLLAILLGSHSVLASNDKSLDNQLSQRCLGTLDFIKSQNLSAFMAEMPAASTKGQEKRLTKILERAYKRRFGKGEPHTVKITGVSYEDAPQAKQDKFGAIELAKIKIYIESDSLTSYARCEYMRTADGWFLSSLP